VNTDTCRRPPVAGPVLVAGVYDSQEIEHWVRAIVRVPLGQVADFERAV
jgi:hypothetical protein